GETPAASVLNLAVVSAEYFDTMGIRLRSGRAFESSDLQGTLPVAVLSQRAARLLGGEDRVLGRRIRFGDSPRDWRTGVGVWPETRYRAIRADAPTVYIPITQFQDVASMITTVAVRASTPTSSTLAAIRASIARTDRDVTVFHAAALTDLVTQQFTGARLNAVL